MVDALALQLSNSPWMCAQLPPDLLIGPANAPEPENRFFARHEMVLEVLEEFSDT